MKALHSSAAIVSAIFATFFELLFIIVVYATIDAIKRIVKGAAAAESVSS